MSLSPRLLFSVFFSLMLLLSSCSAFKPVGTSSTRSPSKRTKSKESQTEKITFEGTEGIRKGIVETARDYQGARYKYGGQTPKGFDCSGFTCYVMKKNNIDLQRTSAAQSKQGKRINLKYAKPGDLLFFGGRNKISHVAIVTNTDGKKLKVIHSTSSKGVIEQDISHSDYWQSRLLFARRIIQ